MARTRGNLNEGESIKGDRGMRGQGRKKYGKTTEILEPVEEERSEDEVENEMHDEYVKKREEEEEDLEKERETILKIVVKQSRTRSSKRKNLYGNHKKATKEIQNKRTRKKIEDYIEKNADNGQKGRGLGT